MHTHKARQQGTAAVMSPTSATRVAPRGLPARHVRRASHAGQASRVATCAAPRTRDGKGSSLGRADREREFGERAQLTHNNSCTTAEARSARPREPHGASESASVRPSVRSRSIPRARRRPRCSRPRLERRRRCRERRCCRQHVSPGDASGRQLGGGRVELVVLVLVALVARRRRVEPRRALGKRRRLSAARRPRRPRRRPRRHARLAMAARARATPT